MNWVRRSARWWRAAGALARSLALGSVAAAVAVVVAFALSGHAPASRSVAALDPGLPHGHRRHDHARDRSGRRRRATRLERAGRQVTRHRREAGAASVHTRGQHPAAHRTPSKVITDPSGIGALLGALPTPSGPAGVGGGGTTTASTAPVPRAAASAVNPALSPVTIGVDYQDAASADTFFRQYGVDAGAADAGPEATATANWINAHGGLDGHRLVLLLHSYTAYGERQSVEDEATCADFAAAHVLVDVDRHASTDILIPCLAQHGIATLVDSESDPDLSDFAHYPDELFSLGGAALDRPPAALVQGLESVGFFSGAKVGVLEAEGFPQEGPASTALAQALAAAGVHVAVDAKVEADEPAAFFADETDAELKMRLSGVTRIVVFDDGGIVAGQFMRDSQAQNYHPEYGLDSVSAPQFLATEVPAQQLIGTVGIGFSPLLDVPASADPNPTVVRALCDQIFSAAGIDTGLRTPFGQYTSYHTCTSLLALKAAFAASGVLTLTGLQQGLESIGSELTSPLSLGTSIGPGRHDGASVWRIIRYQSACGCFEYEGPSHEM